MFLLRARENYAEKASREEAKRREKAQKKTKNSININSRYVASVEILSLDATCDSVKMKKSIETIVSNLDLKTVVGESVKIFANADGLQIVSPNQNTIVMAHALKRINYTTSYPRKKLFIFVSRLPQQVKLFAHVFTTADKNSCQKLTNELAKLFTIAFKEKKSRNTERDRRRNERTSNDHERNLPQQQDLSGNHPALINFQNALQNQDNPVIGNHFVLLEPTPLQLAPSYDMEDAHPTHLIENDYILDRNIPLLNQLNTPSFLPPAYNDYFANQLPQSELSLYSQHRVEPSAPPLRTFSNVDSAILETKQETKLNTNNQSSNFVQFAPLNDCNFFCDLSMHPTTVNISRALSTSNLLEDVNMPFNSNQSIIPSSPPLQDSHRLSQYTDNQFITSSKVPSKLYADDTNTPLRQSLSASGTQRPKSVDLQPFLYPALTLDNTNRPVAPVDSTVPIPLPHIGHAPTLSKPAHLMNDVILPYEVEKSFPIGHFSSLDKESWYQSGLSREIVIEILMSKAEGSFFIRESFSQPGNYALSLRTSKEVEHFLIQKVPQGFKIKTSKISFPDLRTLVLHHSIHKDILPCTLTVENSNPLFLREDQMESSDSEGEIEDPVYTMFARESIDYTDKILDIPIQGHI